MIVTIHLGKQVKTRTSFRNKKILIGNSEFQINLTSLEIQDFDLILGMVFLSKYNARVDYLSKIMELQDDWGNQRRFQGYNGIKRTKWITTLKATRLIEKGAYGYLTFVQVDGGKMELCDIPIVLEFPDVFPEDLLGLSPHREIEFTIETLLGTKPIFIPHIEWLLQN